MAKYEAKGFTRNGDEYYYKDETARTNIGDVSALTTTATDLASAINELDSEKVDKESGKGLSTNDYTTAEKTKLAGIATGAEVNVQADWNESDSTSDAFIQNKPTIPDQLSDLTDDASHRLVTDTEKATWNAKLNDFTYNSTTEMFEFN